MTRGGDLMAQAEKTEFVAEQGGPDELMDLPTPAEARLVARALRFTAGEPYGGTAVESFEDDELWWMARLGAELLARAVEAEAAHIPPPGAGERHD